MVELWKSGLSWLAAPMYAEGWHPHATWIFATAFLVALLVIAICVYFEADEPAHPGELFLVMCAAAFFSFILVALAPLLYIVGSIALGFGLLMVPLMGVQRLGKRRQERLQALRLVDRWLES